MEKLSLEMFKNSLLPQSQIKRIVGGAETAGANQMSGSGSESVQFSYSKDEFIGGDVCFYDTCYEDDNGNPH
jgi:hypothetical protein